MILTLDDTDRLKLLEKIFNKKDSEITAEISKKLEILKNDINSLILLFFKLN